MMRMMSHERISPSLSQKKVATISSSLAISKYNATRKRAQRLFHKILVMRQQERCIVTTVAGNHSGRRRSFRAPNESDIQVFSSILDDGDDRSAIVQDVEELAVRNTDWTRQYRGNATLLLKPRTVQQISHIMQHCQEQHLAVVPQGGRTGLVGGSVPVVAVAHHSDCCEQQIILSLERLNSIVHFDPHAGILSCQAGCVLQDLQTYCRGQLVGENVPSHLVPLDLGAKGSCQIGGNLSTNAGGPYYYRYGSLAANVVGIQVVLANGRILDLNYSTPNLKNNTGYKLHQLFIGAEGTLGIITAVALHCGARYPTSRQAALVACNSYPQVLQVLNQAKTTLSEILAALEWMDRAVVAMVAQQVSIPVVMLVDNNNDDDNGTKNDGDNDDDNLRGCYYPYYLLVETHGSSIEHDQAKMDTFLETCLERGYIADGVLAQDVQQVEHFWTIRELCNPATMATGYGYKYDLSLPVAEFADFIDEIQDHCRKHLNNSNHDVKKKKKLWNGNWGHILDGNIHFNITTPGHFECDETVRKCLEPFIFQTVLRRGGSISAEHGLGQQKNEYLNMVYDNRKNDKNNANAADGASNELHVMQSLKDLFDPTGILNPYKYLPSRIKSGQSVESDGK
jgi:FAD/FMN-containing dehydrogenase